MSSLALVSPVLAVTTAIGLTAALLAWRERPEPGSTPLVVMLAGQCWWSAFLLFGLEASTFGAKVFWADLRWVGIVVIPVAWLLFALEYTGRDEYVRPKYVAALSVVPAITVVLALGSGYTDLLYVDSELVQVSGGVVLQRTPGPWFWVITAYTYLLGALGSFPLLKLVRSDATSFRGQSVALLVGTLAPWFSNVLFLTDAIPVPGLDPTPIAFAVSGLAYLGALSRFRLFGTSPSPNRRARRYVLDQLQEGAVVVDRHGFVVDMNDSAAAIMGALPRTAIGRPADEVVPEYETIPTDSSTANSHVIHSDHTDRPYDVSVTEITDIHDRLLGRVMTFHDISDHRRQKQRHQVLNRVFRHNVRNQTSLIIGYAELLAQGEDSDEARKVTTGARRIERLAAKARTIVDIFEYEPREDDGIDLADTLTSHVESVRTEHPNVAVECGPLPADAHVASVLDDVIANLLENAVEHNEGTDPQVTVTCERAGDRVCLSVADNGPGIGEHERDVLERGSETQLDHGSGLGLWVIKWGTEIADGAVTFTENDPTGSVVTVEVPLLDAPDRPQNPSQLA